MLYETIIPNRGSSILKKNYAFKYFPPNWHYHREYELLIITEGAGKRFAGNGVTTFREGDVALFGSNLPHFHLSDHVYHEDNDLRSTSQVIQFVPEVFPKEMDKIPAFQKIDALLKRSECGILFGNSELKNLIRQHFETFDRLDGISRLMDLYSMLDLLGSSTEYTLLSISGGPGNSKSGMDDMTVYKSYQYLVTHFKEDISLRDVADYAGRNPSALCRSFKSATGRTLFGCLMEIRMDQAYRLLTGTDFTVLQIAKECGFPSISHFNHKFLEMTGVSPLEYRTQSRNNL